MNKKNKNPWTPDDERSHSPCALEWWCPEVFFKTVEDNKKWSFNASITEGSRSGQKMGYVYKTTLFDQDNNKHFKYLDYYYLKNAPQRNGFAKPDSVNDKGDGFYVGYNDSYMSGLYPDYKMHLKDPKNDILLDFKLHAKSMPHWVAQDVTNGWLPWGLGYYRYGFIPKLDVSGTMKIKNKTFKIEGIGYFEHVWGDWSLHNPVSMLLGLKKTISIYSKLGGWWLHNNKIKIPKSIMFTSENNPIGYDWAWAVMDNGWTIFYGNVMFWIMRGPAAGTLILSKDDENYEEFCNIDFKYNKIKYSKNYDFYYPSELEVTARKGREILNLRFEMTDECREFVQKLSARKYWRAFVICEAPGIVDGYYFDGEKKIKLRGFSKMEPQRQISILGHNSLKLDFLLPPKGVGVSLDLNSHFFRKKILTNIQLAPCPKINFSFDRIDDSKIH